jgi:alkylation response protein AidB-like acyl-CoA dehydrogenase
MHSPLLEAEVCDQIRETARRFAQDVVRPAAASSTGTKPFPVRSIARWASSARSASVPDDHGGAGLDTFSYAIVMQMMEELSRGYASIADQCGVVEVIGNVLTVRHPRAA